MPRLLALTLFVTAVPLSGVRAQAGGTAADLQRLQTALHEQALALLERDGITFYALGAFVGPDGTLEGFGPDQWPDFQSPPGEWGDSLVAGFRRSRTPARAVAMLVDWGLLPDTLPRDTFAVFHAETATLCQELREPITGLGEGGPALGWGRPSPQVCARRFWPGPDSAR